MSDSKEPFSVNVRSPRYFIARTRGVCWHCKRETDLFALALPPGHETLDWGEDVEDESAPDIWQSASGPALLFHIEFLPVAVRSRLAALTREFRIGRLGGAGDCFWTNHCGACGCGLDDQELFCEPGGAFLPISQSAASTIYLLVVDEPLEAAASGYAFDPHFFHAMSMG